VSQLCVTAEVIYFVSFIFVMHTWYEVILKSHRIQYFLIISLSGVCSDIWGCLLIFIVCIYFLPHLLCHASQYLVPQGFTLGDMQVAMWVAFLSCVTNVWLTCVKD